MAWYEYIDKKISKLFYHYGKLIARHPRVFLVGSLILAAVLSLGVLFLTFESDATYLFTPDTSRARQELAVMKEQYPVDYDNYWPSRAQTTDEKMGNFIIIPKEGDNVLTDAIIDEVLEIDSELHALEVEVNQTYKVNFTEICGEIYGQCLGNPILKFLSIRKQMGGSLPLTYPVTLMPDGTPIFIGNSLGGVTLGENDTIISARALAIGYLLKSGTTDDINVPSLLWEESFTHYAMSCESQTAWFSYLTSQSVSEELMGMTERVMPLFIVTFSILFTFAVGSCLMTDWVQSKPWLGQLGVISACLAIASAVGLLSACGIPFNEVVASMPFLVIGIGIDDMFIMLAAWRKTSRLLPVEERMGHAYSEAAVSITITSLTDGLAFCIGAITPLPAVRMFCLFSGVAILFDYIYQISFFGACMVYTGQREANSKHCYTCKKVLPKEEAPSRLYRMWCSGGISKSSKGDENTEQAITYFFGRYYGPFIVRPVVKALVVLSFLGYLGVAVYGCLHVQTGLEIKDIFADDSDAQSYIKERSHFTQFGASLSVVITEEQKYWNANVQEQIEEITQGFESDENIHGPQHTESWLRDFTKFLNQTLNTTAVDQNTFVSLLRNNFLTLPYFDRFKQDIVFTKDGEDAMINSSRFIVTSGYLESTSEDSSFMLRMREKADDSSLPLLVYSPPFLFIEQYVIVVPNTIQNLIIATVCMFFIALILIPHPVCAFVVTVCIATIETGVIGVMSLWGVKLDGISMINIILCIGFSVDFSAHITYAFITSPGRTGNQRTIEALHSLGTPILQGGLSTVLAILILSTSPAYIFRAFFKTMFLVMVFGLLHGLVFLPVLLSFLSPCLPKSKITEDVQAPNGRVPSEDVEEEPHCSTAAAPSIPAHNTASQAIQHCSSTISTQTDFDP